MSWNVEREISSKENGIFLKQGRLQSVPPQSPQPPSSLRLTRFNTVWRLAALDLPYEGELCHVDTTKTKLPEVIFERVLPPSCQT
ncbi:hypothetical protein BgiMline_026920 [Biomphalaria glabrata]|nr:hypothetical protein BgiMline_021357 [Biomphalaria glabrata]